jgi:hypothetical protein
LVSSKEKPSKNTVKFWPAAPISVAYPLAFALLSLLSAMNASAILPAQPSDAGLESPHAENSNPSEAPATDFGSLLFMFSSGPQSEPGIGDGSNTADAESAEGADLDPEKLSLRLVLTPAVISLYDPPQQVVNGRQGFIGEFSEALDLSPVYSNEHAAAQALPFEGRLPEEPRKALGEFDVEKSYGDDPSFCAEVGLSAMPAEGAETAAPQKAGENILSFPPTERAGAGLSLENDARKDNAANFAFTPEPAQTERSEQISSVPKPDAGAGTAPSRAYNLAKQNSGQDKPTESEGRDREAPSSASSRPQINLPRDSENFVLPGSSTKDHLAARVEGSSSPSEKSDFLIARKGDSSDVEPNAQSIAQGTFFRGLESERTAAPQAAHVWSSTIERLAAEISTHIRQNRHEVTMHLEPPELGNLRIELSLDGDRLQARVTAEVADAGNLIQTHLPELRQALQAHKLDLVNVQVDLGGWAGLGAGLAQDSRQQSRESADLATLSAISQASDGEAKELSKPTSASGGSVSVWA